MRNFRPMRSPLTGSALFAGFESNGEEPMKSNTYAWLRRKERDLDWERLRSGSWLEGAVSVRTVIGISQRPLRAESIDGFRVVCHFRR